jgi:hypothetical protein
MLRSIWTGWAGLGPAAQTSGQPLNFPVQVVPQAAQVHESTPATM